MKKAMKESMYRKKRQGSSSYNKKINALRGDLSDEELELLSIYRDTFWENIVSKKDILSEDKFNSVFERYEEMGFYTFCSGFKYGLNLSFLCKFMTTLWVRNRKEYNKFLRNNKDSIEEGIETTFRNRLYNFKKDVQYPSSFCDMETLYQMFKDGKVDLEYSFENGIMKFIGSEIAEIDKQNPVDMFPEARAMHRHFVIHVGGTNTGKTYSALQELRKNKNGVYLGPLRLLALEVQDTLNADGFPCSLVTGEERNLIKDAPYMSSTVEMLDLTKRYEIIVIDECQMVSDEFRGGGWTRAILGGLSHEIHLCTAPEGVEVLCKLIELCGDTYEIINHERLVPLNWENKNLESIDNESEHETVEYKNFVQKGDALIVFSRKNVLALASDLEHRGIKASVIYGALPYSSRKNQVERFINGETDVVVATDAIGMGLNLPIKRIIFMEDSKYDGKFVRPLNTSEIKQIAGRAGRYGIYDKGYVNSIIHRKFFKRHLSMATEVIDYAYLDFPEELLKLPYFFDVILRSWYAADTPSLFKKEEISEILFLYDLKKKDFMSMGVSNREIFDLCSVPVNIKSEVVINQWVNFCTDYLISKKIEKPKLHYDSLLELEDSYKVLDLYFAFSAKMGLDCDERWVIEEKEILSDKINLALLAEMDKVKTKRCSSCGKPLPWFYKYGMCEKCYVFGGWF